MIMSRHRADKSHATLIGLDDLQYPTHDCMYLELSLSVFGELRRDEKNINAFRP